MKFLYATSIALEVRSAHCSTFTPETALLQHTCPRAAHSFALEAHHFLDYITGLMNDTRLSKNAFYRIPRGSADDISGSAICLYHIIQIQSALGNFTNNLVKNQPLSQSKSVQLSRIMVKRGCDSSSCYCFSNSSAYQWLSWSETNASSAKRHVRCTDLSYETLKHAAFMGPINFIEDMQRLFGCWFDCFFSFSSNLIIGST